MSDLDFRLSKTVRPVRYDLGIEVDLDAWQFRGSEEIEVTVDEPSGSVTLHAAELEITAVRAILSDGVQLKGSVALNPVAETATLRFDRELPAGTARLCLDFRGTILARLRGFYRSQKDGARYAATQFEAADARRAFPCFDEPEFKARFALTLNVPAHLTAISNGAVQHEAQLGGGRKEVQFTETPPISSYLVAYTVGPYEATPPAYTRGRAPVRVFLPRGLADKGVYARDVHVRSLDCPRGIHRHSVSVWQGRRDRHPGFRGRRHGESGRHHLPPHRHRRRFGTRLDAGAEGDLLYRRTRAHPHVVGRSRHHGLVGRPVAERVVRNLHRLQDRRRIWCPSGGCGATSSPPWRGRSTSTRWNRPIRSRSR